MLGPNIALLGTRHPGEGQQQGTLGKGSNKVHLRVLVYVVIYDSG